MLHRKYICKSLTLEGLGDLLRAGVQPVHLRGGKYHLSAVSQDLYEPCYTLKYTIKRKFVGPLSEIKKVFEITSVFKHLKK